MYRAWHKKWWHITFWLTDTYYANNTDPHSCVYRVVWHNTDIFELWCISAHLTSVTTVRCPSAGQCCCFCDKLLQTECHSHFFTVHNSWHGLASILTQLWTEGSGVWFLARARNFSFHQNAHTDSGATQPPIQWVMKVLSLGVKWLVHGADHSPRTTAEVRNVGSYTSTPTVWLHGITQRDNFTVLHSSYMLYI
jgi:hypothetical protein